MDYMTLKEASEQWGVTPRWINYYIEHKITHSFTLDN